MKYAIIELAGRQFMVKEGDTVEVTRQSNLSCKTLFYKDGDNALIGTPYLDNVPVVLDRIEDKKDTKVVVARYKSKSRYRRKKGHRQPITVVSVKSINGSTPKEAVKKVKKEVKEENK